MKRLPAYDNKTAWPELAAFLALGLAGATLTGLAFFSGPRLASAPNGVHESVPTQRMEAVNEEQNQGTNLALTNVLLIRSASPAGQSPLRSSVAAPQS